MKLRTLIRTAVAVSSLPLLVFASACGGKKTVASKSAAAYDEAQQKGLPVGESAEHGGHSATASSGEAPPTGTPMDHSQMSGDMAGMDHSKMSGGNMAGMDHSKMNGSMAGMDHSKKGSGSMAGMDHSKMSGGSMAGMNHGNMQHGTAQSTAGMNHGNIQHAPGQSMGGMNHEGTPGGNQPTAGMQHGTSSTTSMDHGSMQHGSTAAIPPGGLWGPVAGAAPAATASPAHGNRPLQQVTVTLGTAPAPTTSREMSQLQPSTTLRADSFDIAAPVSVNESAKSTQGSAHAGHTASPATNQTPAATDPHAGHGGASNATETIYACPMHPEVTSAEPGRCPKCGMELVKKEK